MDNRLTSGRINTVFGRHGHIWLVVATLAYGNFGPAFAQENGGAGNSSSPVALDLSSTNASIPNTASTPVDLHVGGSAETGTITGGSSMTFSPGQMLTPAQYVAVMQVLHGSAQTIVLGAQGQASGGYASVTSSSGLNISSLVVPQNVVLNSIGFTPSSPFSVTGDARLSGSLYALQNQPGLTAALNFGNLTITTGGLLSTVLPSTSTLANVYSSANLNLNVAGTLANSGTIATAGVANISAASILNQSVGTSIAAMSAQTLNLVTGTGSMVNSGLLSAANSINIATANAATDLNINGTNGVMEALNGAINIRDPLYALKNETNIIGGQFLAQELNLNAGNGTLEAHVEDTSAIVNVTAGNMHLGTNSGNLTFGSVNVTGDPIIYNTAGDISLGPLTFTSADLILLASGRISTGDITLNSSAGSKSGSLFAVGGASITVGPPATNTPGVQQGPFAGDTIPGAAFTIIGGSGQVGDILMGNVNTKGTTADANGGNVTLVAFRGGVQVTSITTGGNGVGTNGNVQIIAPGGSGPVLPGIMLDNSGAAVIDTTGSTSGTATGAVLLAGAPVRMVGGSVTFTAPATGDFWTVTNSFAPDYALLGSASSKIEIRGNITTDGANIQAITNNSISISAIGPLVISSQRINATGNGGHIELLAGASSLGAGAGTLTFSAASVSINTSGKGTSSGGNITIATGSSGGPGGILYLDASLTSNGGANGAAGNINIVGTSSIQLQGDISATSAASNGGNVYIAPSNWIFNAAANSLGNTLELNYNSLTGGKIDINKKIDTSGGVDAGSITLFGGNAITISNGANIKAQGNSGKNGNLLVLSPFGGITVTTGAIDNSTGGTPGSGTVTLAIANPYLLPLVGPPIVLDPSSGTVSKLPVFTAANSSGLGPSDISINGIKTNGASIFVVSTGNLNLNSAPVTANTVGFTFTGANGGNIALIAGASSGAATGTGSISGLGTVSANGSTTAMPVSVNGGAITIASGGALTIPGDISANGATTAVAWQQSDGGVINIVSADSITQTTGKLQAAAGTGMGKGGKINLIAGNNYLFDVAGGPSVDVLLLGGASAGGGSVTVGGAIVNVSAQLADGSQNAGSVFLTAFKGSTIGSGTVTISNGANFQLGGHMSASDGGLLVLAPTINVTGLNTGAGGSELGGGSVVLATAIPFSPIKTISLPFGVLSTPVAFPWTHSPLSSPLVSSQPEVSV